MTLRDMVAVSFGNLTRLKLRTLLTSAGVLIAIAAFVSMLSFGAGNQKYIEEQFDRLGLFTTIQVYPKDSRRNPDTIAAVKLNTRAIERIAAIPGVNLAYPFDAFTVKVKIGDSTLVSSAQALPASAMRTKLFSNLLSGKIIDSSNSRQVILSEDLIKNAGIHRADSLVGLPIIISVRVSTLDSAFRHVFVDKGETLLDRARQIKIDSLFRSSYRSRILRREANEIVRRFVDGFLNAQKEISDTLTVAGIRQSTSRMGRLHIEQVIIPIATASKFKTGGMSNNPIDIFSAMQAGSLFSEPGDNDEESFSQVTVNFDPKVFYKSITDSIDAMGYRTFSFAAEFEQIQRAMLYFNLALALIGLIALTTASLGIVNTMVMSITERRKEIGILKSLGADDHDIRVLFLTESGAIGFLGTTGGIIFGWVISRVASAIAQAFMMKQGIPPIDLFALPIWLILIALVVGITVSVLAGYYPAARASRVDPVEALRNE